MTGALIVCIAVLVDVWLKEPARWHPLVGFGYLASQAESRMYGNEPMSGLSRRWRGVIALIILLLPVILLSAILASVPVFGILFEILMLYVALGGASLIQHARQVKAALSKNDVVQAQDYVACIVSRDTRHMDARAVAAASIESTLENGNDAIFGALFWFLIAGAPGVIGYRLVNTLDAMWGYRNERYQDFGWAAARLDDVLNWLPARLTAFAYMIVGDFVQGWRCWKNQARLCESPNAGVVMATGAGALGVTVGGDANYEGVIKSRPELGVGPAAEPNDIERAIHLMQKSLWLWVIVIFLVGIISSS